MYLEFLELDQIVCVGRTAGLFTQVEADTGVEKVLSLNMLCVLVTHCAILREIIVKRPWGGCATVDRVWYNFVSGCKSGMQMHRLSNTCSELSCFKSGVSMTAWLHPRTLHLLPLVLAGHCFLFGSKFFPTQPVQYSYFSSSAGGGQLLSIWSTM